MSRTIAEIKTKITSRLHGTTLNEISDFYVICEDASEKMLMRIDPQETARHALLPNPVYDKVLDYAIPEDFKSPKDLNVNANADKTNNATLSRTYSREIGNRRANNSFAINWKDGVQFMRFVRNLNTPLTIDKADSLTENGTWVAGGNASNLQIDTLNFVSGTGSLVADVSNSGAIVSVSLHIGNDNANYYEKTVTTGHFNAFTTAWNLLRFDLANALLTGSVNLSSIDYVKVIVTYNTNLTATFDKTLLQPLDLSVNYKNNGSIFAFLSFDSITSLSLLRLDNITANLGTLFDMDYYSNCLFRSTAGVWKSKPTSDTDIVNLSTVSYKIFEAEISRIITQQVQGAMGIFDYTYWNNELEGDKENNRDNIEGLYDIYGRQFPSERIEGQTTYYNSGDNMDDMYGNGNIDGQPLSYYS